MKEAIRLILVYLAKTNMYYLSCLLYICGDCKDENAHRRTVGGPCKVSVAQLTMERATLDIYLKNKIVTEYV